MKTTFNELITKGHTLEQIAELMNISETEAGELHKQYLIELLEEQQTPVVFFEEQKRHIESHVNDFFEQINKKHLAKRLIRKILN